MINDTRHALSEWPPAGFGGDEPIQEQELETEPEFPNEELGEQQ
jgi:hypothetical protein